MVTVPLSVFGYCRTVISRMAWSPAMSRTRFSAIARTGRRMKTSVIRRGMGPSAVGGSRLELGLRLDGVAHRHPQSVAQLERSRRDDGVPGADALVDGDEVAARGTQLHE